MKHWIALTGIATLAAILLPLTALGRPQKNTDPAPLAGLALTAQASGEQHLPGELITLSLKITNQGRIARSLPRNTGVLAGNIKVYIAYGDQPFQEYVGPMWGALDTLSPARTLAPNAILETSATLLFNHAPQTTHLSPMYATQAKSERVNGDYAFDKAGLYRVKAVLLSEDGKSTAASPTASVQIVEPKGDEARVWAALRGEPDLGYFIQTGVLRGDPNSDHSRSLLRTLSAVVANHPNSVYAPAIAPVLAKFRNGQRSGK